MVDIRDIIRRQLDKSLPYQCKYKCRYVHAGQKDDSYDGGNTFKKSFCLSWITPRHDFSLILT